MSSRDDKENEGHREGDGTESRVNEEVEEK